MEPLTSDKPDIQGERILWHVLNLGMAHSIGQESQGGNQKFGDWFKIELIIYWWTEYINLFNVCQCLRTDFLYTICLLRIPHMTFKLTMSQVV